jgi:predicted transposase YbfD/YdcC
VDREVRKPGEKATCDSRYFISSLTLTAVCLLRLIRGHWQVENCLHWMKDRGWNEDGHYLKRGQGIFLEMTNTALSLLRLMQKPNESVQELADDARFDPKKVLQIIGAM